MSVFILYSGYAVSICPVIPVCRDVAGQNAVMSKSHELRGLGIKVKHAMALIRDGALQTLHAHHIRT
jgi:hypothetical protein